MIAEQDSEAPKRLLVQLGNTAFRDVQFFGYLDEGNVVVVMHDDEMTFSLRQQFHELGDQHLSFMFFDGRVCVGVGRGRWKRLRIQQKAQAEPHSSLTRPTSETW